MAFGRKLRLLVLAVPSILCVSLRAAQPACQVREVQSLPGSHRFGSDFLEAMAADPSDKTGDVVWGLTADLSTNVPAAQRAMYISRSADEGRTWRLVARVGPEYFDAELGEGERNGLGVFPGGREFVITTQRGAFQVIPQSAAGTALVRPIPGPRVPASGLKVTIAKKSGDPVKAGVVKITADGQHLIVGYGYFDRQPQMFAYRRGSDGAWIEDGPLPQLPTEMDILSMEFGDARNMLASSLYVGTGDQAYRLRPDAQVWIRIGGVGADSAIQGISMVGGPHLAACWGVYNPIGPEFVKRVTQAKFLLHRNEDEAGSNIRAFGVEVDPARPNHLVVASLTGVYTSRDSGQSWKRLNEVPDGEFRSAHFNGDGTVIVSGVAGTFLVNPFSKGCSARLVYRGE